MEVVISNKPQAALPPLPFQNNYIPGEQSLEYRNLYINVFMKKVCSLGALLFHLMHNMQEFRRD